jgi:hypothetical protein
MLKIEKMFQVPMLLFPANLGTRCFVRVIEECCFNSVPDPSNGQTVNSFLKPPKVIESRT